MIIDKRERSSAGEPRISHKASGTTPSNPQDSGIQYAVRVLGEVISSAFSDALRVDVLARQIVHAFGSIGFDDRVEMSNQHPRLVEGLILLEDHFERISRR